MTKGGVPAFLEGDKGGGGKPNASCPTSSAFDQSPCLCMWMVSHRPETFPLWYIDFGIEVPRCPIG